MSASKANKSAPEWSPRKWTVPPGLSYYLTRFSIRCEKMVENFNNGRSRPLMIHGPSGVGKSMFVDYFIKQFQEKTGNKKVFYVNCAAIPGTLLESELFGYEKGAHSMASQSKPGYFEIVKDGVIVLEEIGEMEKQVQAKLLIAIEHKEFLRLGGVEAIEFKGQIVATTNAEIGCFRGDFWYRFDIFVVPPLYKRRQDILYYIDAYSGDLLRFLPRGIILALLAYNWPGNVREIERVCNSIVENIYLAANDFCDDESGSSSLDYILSNHRLYLYGEDEISTFPFRKLPSLVSKLKKERIDIRRIEKVLNPSLLSLDQYGEKFYVEGGIVETDEDEIEGREDVNFKTVFNLQFELAYHGLLIFCKLFLQNPFEDMNLLDLCSFSLSNDEDDEDGEGIQDNNSDLPNGINIFLQALGGLESPFDVLKICTEDRVGSTMAFNSLCLNIYKLGFSYYKFWPKDYREAFVECMKYLTQIQSLEENDLNNIFDLYIRNKSNQFLSQLFRGAIETNTVKEIPIEDVAISDLRELYYETLCNKIGLNRSSQKKIAEIAKLSEGAISQDFTKFKIKEKFSNPNFPPRKRLVFLE